MTDLETLKRLAESATPGPWEVTNDGYFENYIEVLKTIQEGCVGGTEFLKPEDSNYIAAANPQAILELIERLEVSEAALQTFADMCASNAAIEVVKRKAREALEKGSAK